jgi:hypothetical protein
LYKGSLDLPRDRVNCFIKAAERYRGPGLCGLFELAQHRVGDDPCRDARGIRLHDVGGPDASARRTAFSTRFRLEASASASNTTAGRRLANRSISCAAAGCRYVTFQMAEVAVSRQMFADIPMLIARLRAPDAPA